MTKVINYLFVYFEGLFTAPTTLTFFRHFSYLEQGQRSVPQSALALASKYNFFVFVIIIGLLVCVNFTIKNFKALELK